jgi:hypothetical protein
MPWEIPPEHGDERDDTLPFPGGKAERRVRSRGLPSQRGLERRWGIMTRAIRDSFMVRGAGERPVTSSLTSPMCVLPDCSPRWRAFARLAYTCSQKCTPCPVPEIIHRRGQCLRRQCSSARIGSAAYECLEQYVKAGGIVDFRSPCVHKNCNLYLRFKLMERTAREGMTNFFAPEAVLF